MKICIERSDRMGDMILTLPVIRNKTKKSTSYNSRSCIKKKYKICKQFSLIDKTYEKSTSSSSFNNLINSINAENMIIILLFHPAGLAYV